MNILLFSNYILRTGVGNHIRVLSEELSRQGHTVTIVAGRNELNVYPTNGGGYYNLDIIVSYPHSVFKALYALRKIVKERHIELVHCHHRKAALIMKLYNCIWHIPTVYTLHLAPIPHGWLHRLATWCGHYAIAISHEVEEFLHCAFKVPYNRISRVLNGVPQYELEPVSQEEKTNLRRGYGIDNDKLVISLHSRIDAVKNHLAVAEALNMLPDEARNKIVVLCSGNQSGDYYNQLMLHIKAYHLEPQFCFCGWKTAREVIGASDLLLLPSMKEGFGLTCIESMFLRVPVARTKMGGYEDMKNYCIPIEDTTAESIKNCILNFINKPSQYSELVEKAYRFVSENGSVEVMTRKTINVYKAACRSQTKFTATFLAE